MLYFWHVLVNLFAVEPILAVEPFLSFIGLTKPYADSSFINCIHFSNRDLVNVFRCYFRLLFDFYLLKNLDFYFRLVYRYRLSSSNIYIQFILWSQHIDDSLVQFDKLNLIKYAFSFNLMTRWNRYTTFEVALVFEIRVNLLVFSFINERVLLRNLFSSTGFLWIQPSVLHHSSYIFNMFAQFTWIKNSFIINYIPLIFGIFAIFNWPKVAKNLSIATSQLT